MNLVLIKREISTERAMYFYDNPHIHTYVHRDKEYLKIIFYNLYSDIVFCIFTMSFVDIQASDSISV